MFDIIRQRYATELDATMRQIISTLPDEPDFGVMLRYALGWENETGQPFLKPTGKRLRPILLLLCTEAAGGNWKNALSAAAAVEILHNFSLIHDDIQDDSPTRHGRPTVWKHWGLANAINAGDAMLVLAYVAMQNLIQVNIPPERILYIWQIFNQTNLELTRGQHLDMKFERQVNVEVDEYISMIKGKSAALLSACAQIGSHIAQSDPEIATYYAEFGLNIGIAFQIRDDILGIWGNPEITGKSAATDITSRKKSLPVLYGLANSDQLVRIYQRSRFGDQDVAEAIAALDEIDAQKYTKQRELVYYERAMSALESANPRGDAAQWLNGFVEMLFQRRA